MQFHLGYVTETIWNHNFYLPLVCHLTSDLKVFIVYTLSITRSTVPHFTCLEPPSNRSQHKTNGVLARNNSSVIQLLLDDVITTLANKEINYLKVAWWHNFNGCGMGALLVFVSPCFRENEVVTCKIGSFLCSLDNLLQKNVIVFLFSLWVCK